ncbi:unnamed protein product [Schistosoma turkestanicum]|nr:unnamed protein product [Schistosoma turkestanicum]
MYSLTSYSYVAFLFVLLLIVGEFNKQSVYGYIFCHCDTDECRAFGYKECKAEYYCYSIYELNSLSDNRVLSINQSTEITGISISRGCISNSFLTMCTKKEIQHSKQFNSPYIITRCCRDAWCNTDKVKIAQTDWSTPEVKRYLPGDLSNYGSEPMEHINSKRRTQLKTGASSSTSLLTNSRDFKKSPNNPHLIDENFSESLINSKLLHQEISKPTSSKDRYDAVSSRKGIRRKGERGSGNVEMNSGRILTGNFQLSYFNPIKSTNSKPYSMNILLAKPIYVAMGISLAILLFGLIFLSSALLIYRKNKLLHISNCRTVCNYSCHNENSIASPRSERATSKNVTGISENAEKLQKWNQPVTAFPSKHSTDEPLLFNGISSIESMNPSTDYRSLTMNKEENNWLKPTGDIKSPEKEENVCKENGITYYCNHCLCCYSNNINNDTNDSQRSTTNKSFINLSQFNKRTMNIDNIENANTNNTIGDRLHPVICETSEFSLNTDNQKREPSSVSTPLFSIHSSSTHQLPDFIEYRKLNNSNHSHNNNNHNKSLLINDQDTFTWIKNQQSHIQNPIQLQQFNYCNQQLQKSSNSRPKNTQRQIHSMFNDFSGNGSDSSFLYDIDNKNNNTDYENTKTILRQKLIETELDWTVGEKKNNTIQLNGNIDSLSPLLHNDTRRNIDYSSSSSSSNSSSRQENESNNQQSVLPVQFTDLFFPHLPPPPSYPPPPLHQQQEPQEQMIENLNSNNTNTNTTTTTNNDNSSNHILNNKNSLFVDLHRLDMLLQRQRGTGKTSSGGEDNKTIESEQSDPNQTWKVSSSNENNTVLNMATLGHRNISLTNNYHNKNNRFLEYSPDLNKLTERRIMETGLIGLATFRKAEEQSVDLVTPYAQFDLSPDSSMCITAE